jgi:hypothetical protein
MSKNAAFQRGFRAGYARRSVAEDGKQYLAGYDAGYAKRQDEIRSEQGGVI